MIFLPNWLKDYKKNQLNGDITAGIIVAVVLVPQAMAYGMLAGLPVEVALYSSTLPLFYMPLLAAVEHWPSAPSDSCR